MIFLYRDIEIRCQAERNNSLHDKYYPSVVQASTVHSYPFSVPSANIEIITNTSTGTSGFTSPIRADDIVRLQVAIKTKPNQSTVWQDLFSGRIQSIQGTYGNKNTTQLNCVGHIEEADYTFVEADKAYATATDAQTIIGYFINLYKRKLVCDSVYVKSGISIPAYNAVAWQTNIADVFQEMEKMSGADWFIDCLPTYDSNGNFVNAYVTWQPFSNVVTDEYKIIEGTDRFISADFESSIEDLITYYRCYGDNNVDTVNQFTVAGNATQSNAGLTGTAGHPTGTISQSDTGSHGHSLTVTKDANGFVTNVSLANNTVDISASVSGSELNYTPAGSTDITAAYSNTMSGAGAKIATTRGLQYKGFRETVAALITQYGKRAKVETFTWIKTDTQCDAIANGIITDRGKSQKSGTITILGTPACHVGDLVYIKLPSVEVDGEAIIGTYTVYRVQHNITSQGFVTILDVGRATKDAYDYVGMVSKVAKTSHKNFCKG